MKTHILVLEVEEVSQTEFNSNFSCMGNDHVISQAIGAAMRRDGRFRNIVLEAIDNMVAGVDMTIRARTDDEIFLGKVKKKEKKIDG